MTDLEPRSPREVATREEPARRERPGLGDSVTGFVGAVSEAWTELRVHRTRVLMSLIGVGVAVAAITTVTGLGGVARQALVENQERSGGRPALVSINAYNPTTGAVPDARLLDEAFDSVVERYSISHSSRLLYTQQSMQLPQGVVTVESRVVDRAYGAMYRIPMAHGEWFSDGDADRLAPAVIVNEVLYQELGSPELRAHPALQLSGDPDRTAVIVGVSASATWEFDYHNRSMFMLSEGFALLGNEIDPEMFGPPSYQLWVPPESAEELMQLISRDIGGAIGEGFMVDSYRQDYAAHGEDPFLPIQLVISGVGVLVLLLGALGLVNIALVTVRQRIREIGIRRSFGATAGRVFFSVMMESVVATFAAGVVGVIVAVIVVENPWVQDQIAQGISDLPPFPVEAALLGLGASLVVGAVAGLLPALVAVRVKVIDAIRY